MAAGDIFGLLGGKKDLMKLLHGGTTWFDDEPSGPTREETRWDRAVTAINALSQQVTQIDPDGIDVYCFPGGSAPVDRYVHVKDSESMKEMVSARGPGGPCIMHDALNMAFADCKKRPGTRPCSILVITAAEPSDHKAVISSVSRAINEQRGRLTVTFVHIGDDPRAEAFLRHLDSLDQHAVDTLKDEEIHNAMDEMQQPDFRKGLLVGGLCGAVVGLAAGAGGAHAYSKRNADRRVRGWTGSWEIVGRSADQPSGVVVTVGDDLAGNLTIVGYPEDGSFGPPSTRGAYRQDDGGFYIMREVQAPTSRRSSAHAKPAGSPCVNGCGHSQFGSYRTCCSHCKGPGGPHARDCKRFAFAPDARDDGRRASAPCTPPCSCGCGRQAFGRHPTCCNQCTGPSGPHARDCSAKSKTEGGPAGPGTAKKKVTGTVVDEHMIQWSDGTSWREVSPVGKSWDTTTVAAGAGGLLAGAGIGGALGVLIQKAFFQRACDRVPGDYVIVVDRSEKMTAVDKGPGFAWHG